MRKQKDKQPESDGNKEAEAGPQPEEPQKVQPEPPAEEPRSEHADLEQKLAELDDRFRRSVAEMANTQKRFERDRQRAGKIAVAGFVEKLLPMIDNMAHSLKHAHESHDAADIIEGFGLIETQMLQILSDSGIKPIESVGKPFDPEVHHAVTTEITGDVPPGTVTEELGRGFIIDDFVIRPAQVKVAAAPPDEKKEDAKGADEEKE
ncbi:MAG: nucleotide exchange factor GrpE [Planctomycetota bacterium]